MRYFSTFSGIGGFELGIGPHHECVGYSEIDKYATAIYQKHFPYEKCESCRLRCLQSDNSERPKELNNTSDELEQREHTNNCQCRHKPYGDITAINEKELPDFDMLVGGFPCQAFSIAGKRGGFEDTRGTLFFDLARILRAKQPRLFVFENVKGLLSHDNGQTFATIISTLDELGYDCQWQVLNSKNHGVPQNRERVFIVGHLRGTPRPQVFPFGQDDTRLNERQSEFPGEIQTDRPHREQPHTDSTLLENGKDRPIHQLNKPTHSNDRVYGADGISPTLNTMQGGNRQPFVAQEEMRIRRLTPTECERLQGFPDGWTEGVSDTQRYKCCGNAVTVNVIRDIMLRLV